MLGSCDADTHNRRQSIAVFLLNLVSLTWRAAEGSMHLRASAAMQSHEDGAPPTPPPSSSFPRARSMRAIGEGSDDAAAADADAPPSEICQAYVEAAGLGGRSGTAPPSMALGAAWLPWHRDGGSTPSATTTRRGQPCAPHTMILPGSMADPLDLSADPATLPGGAAAAACAPFKWLAPTKVCGLLTQPPTAVVIVGDSVSRHLFVGMQVGALDRVGLQVGATG